MDVNDAINIFKQFEYCSEGKVRNHPTNDDFNYAMAIITNDIPKLLFYYANSLSSGYLKECKAKEIIITLKDISPIIYDATRLNNFLHSGLTMEGFSSNDIEIIEEWIYSKRYYIICNEK